VQEFCREHHWITGIYEFLQTWGPQKLEDMRGCPIKDYIVLVNRLNVWQARVSNMPVELLTKGKLLLLSCHEIHTELSKCCLLSLLFFFLLSIYSRNCLRPVLFKLLEPSKVPVPSPSLCHQRYDH
jgi:hypothetical protein